MAFYPPDFPGFPTDNGEGPRLDIQTCLELMSGALLNITVSRYIMAAGLTIALYDILLLFSDEVRENQASSRNKSLTSNIGLPGLAFKVQTLNTTALLLQPLYSSSFPDRRELS
jgi:hypothetical protein